MKKYIANYSNRMNRMSFLLSYLLGLLIYITAILVFSLMSELSLFYFIQIVGFAGIIVSILGFMAYILMISKMRANDISPKYSWLLALLSFFIIGLILAIFPGENKKNIYGPKPKKGVNYF